MATKKAKHSAAGQYLGYGLQTVRFCYRLLTAPANSHVLIEHDEDVSVHYEDGSKLLEQVKSAQSQNPISDWARDLWKCLSNWLDDTTPVALGDPKISYRLYVTPVHHGAYVELLSNAKSESDIDAFVKLVREDAKKFGKTKTKVYVLAKQFLDSTPQEQRHLASNFQLICEEDPLQSIRDLFQPSVAPELLDDICAHAIGEAKQQSDLLLRNGLTAKINAGPFQDKIRTYVRRTNLPALLPFSPKPDPSKVSHMFSGRPVFVRQLELVDASEAQQINAVSDYLRASAAKTKWAEQGVLLPDSLAEWDETLVKRHAAISETLAITQASLPPNKLGALLYAECRKLQLQLETKAVPDHFSHGCFNDLADRRTLGWHPEHGALLDQEEQ